MQLSKFLVDTFFCVCKFLIKIQIEEEEEEKEEKIVYKRRKQF